MYHLSINVTDSDESSDKTIAIHVSNDNNTTISLTVDGQIMNTDQNHDYDHLVFESLNCDITMSLDNAFFSIISYNARANASMWTELVLSEDELVQFKFELSKLSKIKFRVNSV